MAVASVHSGYLWYQPGFQVFPRVIRILKFSQYLLYLVYKCHAFIITDVARKIFPSLFIKSVLRKKFNYDTIFTVSCMVPARQFEYPTYISAPAYTFAPRV